ncbi:MAG: DUF1592 domain-containing protein [Planctomycetia bacterium]|nr:DUF1592 domain-containing protein [Planctomycetia bacterium]
MSRRLNRFEYQNTIRDLLGVNVDFQELLPMDSSANGFDNGGEALHVSSFLLERYIDAANIALDLAIANRPQPAMIKQRYSLKQSHQVKSTSERVFRKMDEDDRVVMFSSSRWQAVTLSPFYPPDPGRYRFRISASGVQSSGKPVTYRVDAGLMLMTGKQHLVGYFDAPADESSVVEFTDYLEPRNTIRILPYGLASAQEVHKMGADRYEGPGLAIDWIEVEGPLNESWPPVSHRRIFDDLVQEPAPIFNQRDRIEVVSNDPLRDGERILRRFCRRAFRRTVTDADVAPFVSLVKTKLAEERSFEQAMRVALSAVMVSPKFLFLDEQPGQLDDFALTNRLSYFLWSTMPDEQLLALAETGTLRHSDVLNGQVERLLNDPKANAFVENFVGQWLNLRDIDFTEQSHILYPEFDDMLKASMLQETKLFFAEVLKHDLSLTNFVASDFSMLNGRLAKHYGIPGVEGWEFRRTPLPPHSHRGGLLTMASVLKVTANGTYTSPVTRGVWILERILGTPPSPPPENVPGLVPDVRGATTIREQLAKHRQDESCASCHVEIDPPGFALESFDVIGGWRDRYRLSGWSSEAEEVILDGQKMRYYHGAKVDPADVMPDGRAFQNIDEFKQLLLADKDQLARALATKLVTYGTGAAPRTADQPEIAAIVASVRGKNYGLRSLLHHIVQSKLFQQK